MSQAPRRRGAGRAARGPASSETSSRRGDRLQVPPGGFDGPASRGSGSASHGRQPSNAPSVTSTSPSAPQSGFPPQTGTAGSPRSSSAGQTAPPSQAQAPIVQGDPARESQPRYTDALRNIDLPPSFYNIDQLYSLPTQFAKRPGFNTTGKAVQVSVNSYQVTQYPTAKVYQYDVIIGSGDEKRVVQRKVWGSQARKKATGPPMIYDGNRLAWSITDHNEIRLMVDLDQEEGRQSRDPSRNTFRLHIKKTRQLDISVVQAYLDGRIQFNIEVAEAVNFMDHLLREGPSTSNQFLSLRRSVFKRQGQRADLGGGIEVWRGVYQSMRLAEGKKLVINLDVANTCFWKPSSLISTIITKFRMRDPQQIVNEMRPRQDNGSRRAPETHSTVRKAIKGIMVTAQYKGNPMADKEWKIASLSLNNAHEETMEWKDPQTKKPTGERVSIAQYFKRKYNLALQFPELPLVEMTKKGVMYPMEFLQIISGTRYAAKLDETQTANMIKFAVSPPAQRLAAIDEGKSWLNWGSDPYLNNYGLRVNPQQIKTNARILPAPGVKFGNKIEQPGTKGRWDLRGKKFLNGNPQELVAWGIGVFAGRGRVPDKSAIDRFALDFARAYREHGGQVANQPPTIAMLPADAGKAVEELYNQTGNQFKRRPQLMIFLLQDRNSFHYLRIKKSADCRYGVVTQCMQLQQVIKGNPQYYSNVLMKVNAKLGGTTSQALPHASSGFKGFNAPTMIIGADVSHASPGSQQASMAAITVSFDRFGGRYAAACQTNGHRVEMVSEANWRNMLKPLVTQWMSTVGGGSLPHQIYYIRDGVSEGQFAHVLNQEVPHIKAIMEACAGKAWGGKITVVIAGKRHHVRAFPGQGAADNKGNPLPGCLIERDVTTPNEFDFYLYSHIALQGTSRPTHYSVIYDEANHNPNALPNMLYEHCYQYMRSTTSVSLHPAAYYAHLASNRAKAHEDIQAAAGPQGGAGYKMNAPSRSSEPSDSEVKPLLPLYNAQGIVFAMWYI
ncbi:Protein argonaute [Elasticomyces elasticus]|uniref:Protein argonaute n=1 Tax=Exophiala sideris TaxID=1016849 RepID=A0ABR0JM05_9EURO|nr:Protein argonaute [Elasticomyces elasticus]KAK5036366.1 Protein argonaute [Exophiala sideris]KAK5041802.1 Protein argonaute [Exophiala sideris]KAK5066750.1 Protein argonaute [Exophiala sideris]KAK5184808.1 Protein argonaute [Eurotiomycetes sp. CCFEE 6388]